MTPLVSTVNIGLAWLTIFADIVIVGLLVLWWLTKTKQISAQYLRWIGDNAIKLSFVLAFTATFGSLFYSEIAGFDPCILCWYQRIFMYPLVLLFGIAVVTKDKGVAKYGIGFSIVGALLAGYHYLLQIGVAKIAECSAVGYSAQCTETFHTNYGYITIPMMAVSAFVLIILLLLVGEYSSKLRQ